LAGQSVRQRTFEAAFEAASGTATAGRASLTKPAELHAMR
jgi:hypothetical protein